MSPLQSTARTAVALIACIAAALAGCANGTDDTTQQAASAIGVGRRPPRVLFDTDMDFDDASALAYLCQAHKLGQIQLQAVTVTNDGAGFPGSAIHHARCILERAGLTDIPVADGSASGANSFPAQVRFGVAFILGGVFSDCTASTESSAVPADQLIANTLERTHGDVTLITTGPLTNVASAMQLLRARHEDGDGDDDRDDPIRNAPHRAFIMGGAVGVSGNLCCGIVPPFDNTQELNMWADPASAQSAFGGLTPFSIRLVPLDATQYVPITQSFVDRLSADATTPEAQTVASIVANPLFAPAIAAGQIFWWDPLTAVMAVRGRVVTLDADRISVTQDGAQAGRTVSSHHGAHLLVGTDANATVFENIFLDTLNGRP